MNSKKKSISAEIIADSINPKDCRLTSFVLTFPRPLLSELNTHRVLSKNSASSRAIPFEKMLAMAKEDPFIPIRFQKDHKGMQGTEYYEGAEHEQCIYDWLRARDLAVEAATSFKFPLTKQLRNRLLEPYMWHTVICSATDFENFFALRAHSDAEIHIAKLAELMLEEYNKSEPKSLRPGEWHVPFGDRIDKDRLLRIDGVKEKSIALNGWLTSPEEAIIEELKIKIAIARCGRISYYNFEGKDDYDADIKMCDKLFKNIPKHLSPAEHVAQCMDDDKFIGNFRGWKQYRKMFKDENLTDPRVVKKYYKK